MDNEKKEKLIMNRERRENISDLEKELDEKILNTEKDLEKAEKVLEIKNREVDTLPVVIESHGSMATDDCGGVEGLNSNSLSLFLSICVITVIKMPIAAILKIISTFILNNQNKKN